MPQTNLPPISQPSAVQAAMINVPYKFNYSAVKQSVISLEILDNMASQVVNCGFNYVNMIVVGIKLLLLAAYFVARKYIIDEMEATERQKYEQSSGQQIHQQINGDNLDHKVHL